MPKSIEGGFEKPEGPEMESNLERRKKFNLYPKLELLHKEGFKSSIVVYNKDGLPLIVAPSSTPGDELAKLVEKCTGLQAKYIFKGYIQEGIAPGPDIIGVKEEGKSYDLRIGEVWLSPELVKKEKLGKE